MIRDTLKGKVGFVVGAIICNNSIKKVPEFYERIERINQEFQLTGEDAIAIEKINGATHPGRPVGDGCTTLDESSAICRYFDLRDIDFIAAVGYSKILTGEFIERHA